MRYNALATALTVLIVLCVTVWPKRRLVRALGIAIASVALLSLTTSCSTSRKATEVASSKLQVSSAELRDSSAVERVEVLDTLKEVTTITIDRNDKGDTLKVVQITDRTRARNRDNVVAQKVKVIERIDTVYIQKDSVNVEDKKIGLSASADGGSKRSGFLTYVKWITALVCAVVVLIITVKVCLLRR